MNELLPAVAAPVVVLGLLSALSWGAGDFGGGLASRRAPLLGIVLITQATGVVGALVLAAIRNEPAPGPDDIAWSIVSGVLGVVGITALYTGLGRGRMSVVAPVTGVIAAALPVVVGIGFEGLPAREVLIGIGLALVAVVLVSRAPDETARNSGVVFALVAGTAIGLFNVTIAQVEEGLVAGPLAIMRLTQAACVAAVIAIRRPPWRLRPAFVPAIVVIGLLDLGGNGFYVAATQAGELAIAATLSSLYPVVTVILAALLLRERMGLPHVVGVVLAATAIVLIAGGG